MNTESLKKGNELSERIGVLERQKEYWIRAKEFSRHGVDMNLEGYSSFITVNAHYADFETIRVLQLAGINKLLDEAKEEFTKL